MKKTGAELMTKHKKQDQHATVVINSYQGKVTGVLVRLNYSIHQHALALDVMYKFLMVEIIFNLAKQLMCGKKSR